MFSKLVDPVTYTIAGLKLSKWLPRFAFCVSVSFMKYTANYFGESTQFWLKPMIRKYKFQIAPQVK